MVTIAIPVQSGLVSYPDHVDKRMGSGNETEFVNSFVSWTSYHPIFDILQYAKLFVLFVCLFCLFVCLFVCFVCFVCLFVLFVCFVLFVLFCFVLFAAINQNLVGGLWTRLHSEMNGQILCCPPPL